MAFLARGVGCYSPGPCLATARLVRQYRAPRYQQTCSTTSKARRIFSRCQERRHPIPCREHFSEDTDLAVRKVIVIGAAVMDVIFFHTTDIPPRGTSHEAYAFELAPGGKALWQAVSAARLGLEVSLVAAVPTDRFGDEITNYLDDQGVDTDLIKRVDDAHTPLRVLLTGTPKGLPSSRLHTSRRTCASFTSSIAELQSVCVSGLGF